MVSAGHPQSGPPAWPAPVTPPNPEHLRQDLAWASPGPGVDSDASAWSGLRSGLGCPLSWGAAQGSGPGPPPLRCSHGAFHLWQTAGFAHTLLAGPGGPVCARHWEQHPEQGGTP